MALESLNKAIPSVFLAGDLVLFGRHSDASKDCKFEDLTVSSRHCELFRKTEDGEAVVYVRDLSYRGTFVNAEKIGKGNEVPLKDGDVLTLSSAEFQPEDKTCIAYTFHAMGKAAGKKVESKIPVGDGGGIVLQKGKGQGTEMSGGSETVEEDGRLAEERTVGRPTLSLGEFFGISTAEVQACKAQWRLEHPDSARNALIGDARLNWELTQRLADEKLGLSVGEITERKKLYSNNRLMDLFLAEHGIVSSRRGEKKHHRGGTLWEQLVHASWKSGSFGALLDRWIAHVDGLPEAMRQAAVSAQKAEQLGGAQEGLSSMQAFRTENDRVFASVGDLEVDVGEGEDVEQAFQTLKEHWLRNRNELMHKMRMKRLLALDNLPTCRRKGCGQRRCIVVRCVPGRSCGAYVWGTDAPRCTDQQPCRKAWRQCLACNFATPIFDAEAPGLAEGLPCVDALASHACFNWQTFTPDKTLTEGYGLPVLCPECEFSKLFVDHCSLRYRCGRGDCSNKYPCRRFQYWRCFACGASQRFPGRSFR